MAAQIKRTFQENSFTDKISHFVYLSNEKWLPFPKWARYYLELGSALSGYANEGRRFVAAITLPIRNFASSLIAAGIISSRVDLCTHNPESQISKIESLPVGTLVTFRRNNSTYEGIYQGTRNGFGKQFFIISYQKGGEIAIPYENYYKIELSEKQKISLPKIQSGRQLDPPSSLLKNLFEVHSLNRFSTESRLESVILGQQKTIQPELCEFLIGFQNDNGPPASGKIVDMVRAKGSQYQPSNFSYRTYILPSSGKYNQQFTSKLNNYVTIFDNPLGFIKWRSYFKLSNWFVLLDKTDRNFDLALKEINEEFIQNRIERQIRLPLPTPPEGTELMIFEVNL